MTGGSGVPSIPLVNASLEGFFGAGEGSRDFFFCNLREEFIFGRLLAGPLRGHPSSYGRGYKTGLGETDVMKPRCGANVAASPACHRFFWFDRITGRCDWTVIVARWARRWRSVDWFCRCGCELESWTRGPSLMHALALRGPSSTTPSCGSATRADHTCHERHKCDLSSRVET